MRLSLVEISLLGITRTNSLDNYRSATAETLIHAIHCANQFQKRIFIVPISHRVRIKVADLWVHLLGP